MASFTHTRIYPHKKIISRSRSKILRTNTLQKWVVIAIACIAIMFVIGVGWSLAQSIKSQAQSAITQTSSFISSTFGKEMIKDEYGNINILLVWYGWWWHQWWYLADTIIVASYDPSLHSVSMISIPRDLIINLSWYINKINAILPYKYSKTKDLELSTMFLAQKAGEITSLDIPYYMLIDFEWFEKVIDSLGGIDLYVPRKIYDTTFPWPNWSYTTFSLNSGQQHLDGVTALKYARSRHSTSDFSRSQRQQLILKAVFAKMTDGWSLSLSTVKRLYQSYVDVVKTNISLDEMIGLLRYGKTVPAIHSFGLTMECSNAVRRTMPAWCLLYPVDASTGWSFNGMSWLLPVWSTASKLSYYNKTQYFGHLVAHNQSYLNEAIPIIIRNASDKTYAKKFPYRNGIAWSIASKMRRYGFAINAVENSDIPSTGTIAVVTTDQAYEETIRMMKLFVTIDEVRKENPPTGMSGEILSWNITLYLWNTSLDQYGAKPFNYYNE